MTSEKNENKGTEKIPLNNSLLGQETKFKTIKEIKEEKRKSSAKQKQAKKNFSVESKSDGKNQSQLQKPNNKLL